MRSAEDLLLELHSVDESHRIEAKRAEQIDRSILETVCAFSNEPGLGGGYLLLGVTRDARAPETDPIPRDSHQVPADPHHLPTEMPGDLRARLPAPGSRPRREALHKCLVELCSWRPLSARDLSAILGRRDPKELVREHLSPMVAEGVLAYAIPEMENHPDQRYTVMPQKAPA